jgi:hypothetical protein
VAFSLATPAKFSPTDNDSLLYEDLLLAQGFDIKSGFVFIKCPEVNPNKNHIIVCKFPNDVSLISQDPFTLFPSIRRLRQP